MLKISRALLFLLFSLPALLSAGRLETGLAAVVVRDISVLDPSASRWVPHRDLIVNDTSITAVLPTGQTLPAVALRQATIESARAGGRGNELGSIEPGKLADFVVLDEDPLAAIAHLSTIDVVVFRGEALTRAHLNQLQSRATAGRSQQQQGRSQ